MLRFIFRRFLMLIPVIIGSSMIIFFILSLAKEDPVMMLLAGTDPDELTIELTRIELGLDKPLLVQFGNYMLGLLKGDLGNSYRTGNSVFQEYMLRFPATLYLAFGAFFMSVVIAIPLGIVSATRQYSVFDNVGVVFSLVGVSMPNFWLGLLLLIAFAVNLRWLPAGGYGGLRHLILPAFTIATNNFALITRITRSSMLEVIRQDYIRTARAKGLAEQVIIYKHALKNALIPIITVLGSQFGLMMGGAVLTETIFSWPGVGRLMMDGINKRDRPIVIGCVVLLSIMISLVTLLVDVLYTYADPRVKTSMVKRK